MYCKEEEDFGERETRSPDTYTGLNVKKEGFIYKSKVSKRRHKINRNCFGSKSPGYRTGTGEWGLLQTKKVSVLRLRDIVLGKSRFPSNERLINVHKNPILLMCTSTC